MERIQVLLQHFVAIGLFVSFYITLELCQHWVHIFIIRLDFCCFVYISGNFVVLVVNLVQKIGRPLSSIVHRRVIPQLPQW